MKNKSIIVGLIGVLLVCLITTGCLFKKPLDKDEFKSHFEDLNYSVIEGDNARYEAETYYIARKEDVPFEVEYYNFKNETDAKKAYQDYKSNITDFITAKADNNETTGSTFAKIVTESENEYIVISRVKNTVIFILGTPKNSEEIDEILKDIKY